MNLNETPIRRYEPKLIEEVYSEPIKNCKPGFIIKLKFFSELCDDKKNHSFQILMMLLMLLIQFNNIKIN